MLPYGDSRLASAYDEFHKTKKAKAVQKLFTQAVEIANQKWMEEIGRLQKHLETNVEGAATVKCSKCRSSINTTKQSSKAKVKIFSSLSQHCSSRDESTRELFFFSVFLLYGEASIHLKDAGR